MEGDNRDDAALLAHVVAKTLSADGQIKGDQSVIQPHFQLNLSCIRMEATGELATRVIWNIKR